MPALSIPMPPACSSSGSGRATRLLRFASASSKTYVGEIALGVATSTLDAAGEVTGRADMTAVTPAEVRLAAVSLTGRIEQTPPMVSAVKVGGRRLHELARQGIEVERAARPVEVRRFDIFESGSPAVYRFLVECSTGTYVRVLAADLGLRLGGVAHLRTLRRVAVGSFRDVDALSLDQVAHESLRPCLDLVRDLPCVEVGDEFVEAIAFGRLLDRSAVKAAGEGPWAVVGPAGDLVAVCQARGTDRIHPVVVLAPAR